MNLTLKAQVILEALKYQGVSECLLLWDKPIWNQMTMYKNIPPWIRAWKPEFKLWWIFIAKLYTPRRAWALCTIWTYSGFCPAPSESRRTQWSPAWIFKACLRKLSVEESWPLRRNRACLPPQVVFTGKAGNYKTVTTAQKIYWGWGWGTNWWCQNL